MADKDKDTSSTPDASAGEKPNTHGRKAQAAALAIMVIVIVGLLVQTFASLRAQSANQAKRDADQDAKEASARGTQQAPAVDFKQAKEQQAQQQDFETKSKADERKRNSLLQSLDTLGAPSNPDATDGGDAQAPQTAETVARNQELADIKAAYTAAHGGFGHSHRTDQPANGAGAAYSAGTLGQSAELTNLDQRLEQLRKVPEDIARQREALIQQLKQAGYQGPIPAAPSSVQNTHTSTVQTQPSNALANMQFGEIASNRYVRDPGNPGPRAGEAIIPTGKIISMVLDTDVMSDYSGNFIAVISQPVYDVTLENILIPAGSKVMGKSIRVTGVNEPIQNRMAFLSKWLIRPDGKRISFERAAVVDHAGVAAVQDEIDRHVMAQIFGVAAYAFIGLGPSESNYGAQPNSAKDSFVRDATGQARDIGRTFAQKYLSIVPTVKIRAGTNMKLEIEDDIYVTPWRSVDAGHFSAAQ